MRSNRGFTILEVGFAIGILVVALLAAWALIAQASRHQRFLWDELAAHELAVSTVEREWAKPTVAPALARDLTPTDPYLPNQKVLLFVEEADSAPDLVNLRCVVSWHDPETSHPRTVTHQATRRRTR